MLDGIGAIAVNGGGFRDHHLSWGWRAGASGRVAQSG